MTDSLATFIVLFLNSCFLVNSVVLRMGMRLMICLHALPSFIKYTAVTISFPSYHRASEINSISWTRVDLLAKLNCPPFTRQSIFNTCSSRIRSSVFLWKWRFHGLSLWTFLCPSLDLLILEFSNIYLPFCSYPRYMFSKVTKPFPNFNER